MTRDEMIEKLEGLHAFIYSVSSHGEKEAHDTIRAVIAALRAPAGTVEADKQTPNEAEILRALSDALTGGNASTWEQVLHAAEQHRSELEAHDDVRRTLQAPQGDARGTEGAVADAGVRPVEPRGRGDDRDRSPVVPAPAVGEAAPRPESGPMRFGDDWTGVFIRGDRAGGDTLPPVEVGDVVAFLQKLVDHGEWYVSAIELDHQVDGEVLRDELDKLLALWCVSGVQEDRRRVLLD